MANKTEREEAKSYLRQTLPVGSVVHCLVAYGSNATLCYMLTQRENGSLLNVSHQAAKASGLIESRSMPAITLNAAIATASAAVAVLARELHGDQGSLQSRMVVMA